MNGLLGNATSYPAYATVGVSGQSSWTWEASTSKPEALQKAASLTDRIGACYYTTSSLTYDLNLTDSQIHQVAFYCVDYFSIGRSEKIDILDGSNNVLLDTQNISNFGAGKYLVWNLKGHVKVRLTFLSSPGPQTAVISGLFFK